MKTNNYLSVGAAAVFAVAGLTVSASAQVSPVPQFIGEFSEPLAPVSGFNHCVPGGLFGGEVQLCTFDINTNAPANGAHITSGWSFECVIFPHSPPVLFGSAGGVAEYSFTVPVRRFGGFFGANNNSVAAGGGVATFYDISNNVIDTLPFTLGACGTWEWRGWESTVPVARIRTASTVFGGAFLMMDSLEMDPFSGSNCYPNCDGSTVEPILNIDDFTCFINEFAAGQSLPYEQQLTAYANCDNSTTAPVLNIDDFTCFINSFAAGCP